MLYTERVLAIIANYQQRVSSTNSGGRLPFGDSLDVDSSTYLHMFRTSFLYWIYEEMILISVRY